MKGIAMKRIRCTARAFTLVEMLVVILIISLVATVLAPRVFKGLGKAKSDIAKAKMSNIESAVGRFFIDCGRYPADDEGLDALIAPPSDIPEGKWNGPYLKRSELIDPWDNPYQYRAEGEVNAGSFDLMSLGADGKDGGEGDDKDIYND